MSVLLFCLVVGGVSANIPPPKCPVPSVKQCPVNERYVNCVSRLCVPKTCDELGFPVACPRIAGPCKGGCVCADNYLRNSEGVCIPQENCPSCGGDFNATVGRGINCRRLCTNYDNNVYCAAPLICLFNPCDCKEGYVRDSVSNRCVAPIDCLTPVCGQNEQYTTCGTACPLTCENYNNPSQVCTKQCVEGCFCEPGFVKDSNQRCVKPEECPAPVCGQNEQYTTCGTACPLTCENYNNPSQVCTDQCVEGCFCEPGFVKDSNQRCVKPEECPAPFCGQNEQYTTCGTACPLTCENYNNPSQVCTDQCVEGCFCEPGFVKDSNQRCVKPEECPAPVCGQNEQYTTCGTACPLTCENYNNPSQVCTDQCVEGCFCEPGFVKDSNQLCVKPEECLNQCPVNERYVSCVLGHCDPKTCDELGLPVACPRIIGPCEGGCICVDNYLRNSDGICIPQENCPSCGGDFNATSGCGINCGRLCSNYDKNVNCAIPLICRLNACDCKEGYVQDSVSNRCVAPTDCPAPVCGQNEQYTTCGTACPLTCENYNNPSQVCTDQCVEGCFCEPGFVKDSNQRCVKPEECPAPVCGQNEQYTTCGTACPLTCESYNNPPQVCTLQCVEGCFCEPGFVKDSNQRCVKPEECPAPVCGQNEQYTTCGTACPLTCENYNNPSQVCTDQCVEGCFCKTGFVKDSNQRCVKPKECSINKPCSDPNAERVECASPCQSTCATPNPGPCILSCNLNSCVCKTGYVLSEIGGKCVAVDQCPSGNPCGQNGTFVRCNVGCPTNYCPVNDNRGIITCSLPYPCPSGCACKLNYRKKSYNDETCILASDCPAVNCTRPNEIYSSCPSACLAENCADVNNQPSTCNTLVWNCQPQCICMKGYFRNDEDICIPAEQCPKINCGLNEVFQSNSIVCPPQTCESIYTDYDCNNAAENVPGCDCISGYLRNGTVRDPCIPSDQCPSREVTPECGQNEQYTTCGTACPLTCENYNNPSQVCTDQCVEGCFCEPGFVKDSNQRCVKPEECPAPVCGQNEQYTTCGTACPLTCQNYNNPSQVCTKQCVEGCFCEPGFVKDSNQRCVKPEECPAPVCGQNEQYTTCGTACPLTCENYNNPPQVCTFQCVEGCFCETGFVKDSNQRCVKPEECPINKPCSDPNAERVECASPCQSTCATPNPGPCILSCNLNSCVCKTGYVLSEIGGKCVAVDQCPKDAPCNGDSNAVIKVKPIPCPSTCASPNASPYCKKYAPPVGCECKPGFLKSSDDFDGKCINPEECNGGNPCGKNGTFVWCNAGCPTNYCPVNDNRGIIACSPPYPCPSGCACKLNYRKKSYNDETCILASDCPAVNCTRPNEIYSSCPSACLAENCADVNHQPSTCNTLVLNCQPRCICVKGFFRNNKGICIPAEQCRTPSCGLNEHYETNRNKCDATCMIKDIQALIGPCPATSGCFCDDGFYRNTGGICVTSKQCTPRCDKNEIYMSCGSACERTCQSRGENCTMCTAQCVEGCFCRKGYLRAEDNACVEAKDCPPRTCSNPNEVFDECPYDCPSVDKCSNMWVKRDCSKREKCCKPQCRCKDGYLRKDNGVCVPSQQCTSG